MKKTVRSFLRIGAALGLLILVAALARKVPPAPVPVPPPPPVPVEVARPTVDAVVRPVRYAGTVEGDRDASLAFRTAGTIVRLHVQEGAAVRGGQRLAELALPETAARVHRARSETEKAEATLLHWRRELEIDRRLYEQGAVARTRLDQTRLAYESAERSRDAAAAGVAEALALAEAAVLTAPQAGVIGRIERREGETVLPGQPVILLASGPRRARVDVLQRDLARGIAIGSPALLTSYGCREAPATVRQVDAAVRPPLGSVRVFLDVPGGCLDGLAAGTSVEVSFLLEGQEEALLLPLSAIDLRGGSPRVFRILPDETVEAVPVLLGIQQGDLRQVTGAVGPQDRIVVSGTTRLQPGTRVRAVPARASLPGGAS